MSDATKDDHLLVTEPEGPNRHLFNSVTGSKPNPFFWEVIEALKLMGQTEKATPRGDLSNQAGDYHTANKVEEP